MVDAEAITIDSVAFRNVKSCVVPSTKVTIYLLKIFDNTYHVFETL